VDKLDLKVEDGKVVAFRARLKLSFKYDAAIQKNWSEF
jgi:flavin-binding protein dodecin